MNDVVSRSDKQRLGQCDARIIEISHDYLGESGGSLLVFPSG
jgi:hypothetical protein